MRTIELVQIPAARICPSERCSEIATAAIAFIGWTAIGIEKINPVMILNKPAKNSAEAKSNPLVTLIPTRSGRNVPRSPSEPDISCRLSRGSGKPNVLFGIGVTAVGEFKAAFLRVHYTEYLAVLSERIPMQADTSFYKERH